MHRTLDGKGYVKGGEGVFVTGAGEVYAYRDGGLTPLTTTEDPKSYADIGSPERHAAPCTDRRRFHGHHVAVATQGHREIEGARRMSPRNRDATRRH